MSIGDLSALGEDRMGRGPAVLSKIITVYKASRRHVVFLTEGANDGDDSWVKCALLFFSLAE